MKTLTSSRTIIINIISCLFILLWVYAAVSKLIDREMFRLQIGQSPLLTSIATPVSYLVPSIEIVVTLALLFDRTRTAGLYASFALMALFTLYIIAVTQFSDSIPCSCGGILEKMNWNQHLVFNLILTIMAAAGVLLSPENISLQRTGETENLYKRVGDIHH